ncbi:hypothetical protein PACTADRAFT_15911 [Pachysolen tannophilus NRRL Y-2460]|uniref:Uncharacterized protein n=1 Tax=Pachysolen tannophilus NRRL Y-2460 TaxID=669874 RepID=A0A1E4U0C7_PACTA|nr:hypothetical protein PACTADRAFT_15911 [Pachysolen tannophilus NRRL Y-2460]
MGKDNFKSSQKNKDEGNSLMLLPTDRGSLKLNDKYVKTILLPNTNTLKSSVPLLSNKEVKEIINNKDYEQKLTRAINREFFPQLNDDGQDDEGQGIESELINDHRSFKKILIDESNEKRRKVKWIYEKNDAEREKNNEILTRPKGWQESSSLIKIDPRQTITYQNGRVAETYNMNSSNDRGIIIPENTRLSSDVLYRNNNQTQDYTGLFTFNTREQNGKNFDGYSFIAKSDIEGERNDTNNIINNSSSSSKISKKFKTYGNTGRRRINSEAAKRLLEKLNKN